MLPIRLRAHFGFPKFCVLLTFLHRVIHKIDTIGKKGKFIDDTTYKIFIQVRVLKSSN